MHHINTQRRRQFLKAASALLAAPFISLKNSTAFAQARPPLRLLIMMDAYGVPPNRGEVWASSSVGDYALTADSLGTILKPLAGYRDQLALTSGTRFDSIFVTNDKPLHRVASAQALVGSKPRSGIHSSAKQRHASVDLLIGEYLNNDYGLTAPRVYPHLFLSDRSQSGKAVYCFNHEGSQIRAITGPTSIGRAVFGNLGDLTALQLDTRTQQAALELVAQQLKSVRPGLVNANAATVLDAYEASVSDLATELEIRKNLECKAPEFSELPADDAPSGQTNPAIMSLIHQAFSCDLVSTVTYAPGGESMNEISHAHLYDAAEHNDSRLRSFLGNNLHSASHKNDAAAHKTQELVRRNQAQLLADFLDKMSTTPELDGSGDMMIDNTVVWMTSAQSVYIHGFEDYVNLFFAGKNANLRTGYHYDLSKSTNNDIMTTLANGLNIPFAKVGGVGDDGREYGELNQGPISRMLKA